MVYAEREEYVLLLHLCCVKSKTDIYALCPYPAMKEIRCPFSFSQAQLSGKFRAALLSQEEQK